MTRLERFLANPPRRISATAIRKRKGRTCGSGLRRWLPGLVKEQRGLCFYCKIRVVVSEPRGRQRKATLDHYVPLSRGGANARANCVAACFDCNQAKGNMPPEVFMAGKDAREKYTAARNEMWKRANARVALRDRDVSDSRKAVGFEPEGSQRGPKASPE